MRTLVLSMVFVASVWMPPQGAEAQSLAVVSRAENAVCFLELQSGRISDCIETGRFPHEIAADPDRRFAYIPAYGGNDITKIDLRTRRASGRTVLPGRSSLHGIWVDSAAVWVTSEEEHEIVRIDAHSGDANTAHRTDGYRSHMITGIPGSDMLYVANIDSGSVSLVSAESGLQAVIKTGAGAEGIDTAPDGSTVWVSNRADNTISVIATNTNSIIQSMDSGGAFPVKLRFQPDGRQVWVANNRSGTISVFNATSFKLTARIDVGSRPLGLVFSDDSERAFVSRPGANEIVEIRTLPPYSIVQRFSAPGSPDGLLFLPK